MERKFYKIFRKSTAARLLLLVSLLVGGGDFVWGDTVLFTTNFSEADGWTTEDIITSTTTSATRTIKGTEISFKGYKKSNLSVSAKAEEGSLTFTGSNASASLGEISDSNPNYYMAIPLTGVEGEITVSYTSSNSFMMYYTYDDGSDGTVVTSSNASYGVKTFKITGLSNNNVTLYIGASGKTINSLTITTLEKVSLTESRFYQLYKQSNSSVDASDLIAIDSPPSYIVLNNQFTEYSNSNTSTITNPHDFTGIGSSTYYRLYQRPTTNATPSSIVIGSISNVKSIRLYGNGSYNSGNIKTSVTKISGSGSSITISDISYINNRSTIAEYIIDISGATGYDVDSYYLYTITFSGYFSLWGIYIEAASSCTPGAAPTDLSCLAHSKSSLTFSWTAAANASSYDVTLYNDAECTDQVATANVTTTSHEFTGLNGNTTYYCNVQSKGDGSTYCEYGNVSDAASGTTDSKDYTLAVVTNNDEYGTVEAEALSLDGGETTLVTATANTGYKFRSWAVSGTGSTLSSTTTNPTTLTMGSANATVTATFSALESYTITYNKGANGTGTISNGYKTEDVDFTLSSSTFTFSGHKQTGWSLTDGGEKAFDLGGTYTANANLDLYPYWTEQYTITYDRNGGSNFMTSTTDAGEVTLKANSFVKSGYSFIGWATSQENANNGIVAYADKATYNLTADAILYAVWAENYCEMEPAASGSTLSVGNAITMQDGAFGGTMTITAASGGLAYTSNGLQSVSDGEVTLDIVLNDYLKPGSIILLTLYSSNSGSERGYILYSLDGNNEIATFTTTDFSSTTFQYKVVSDDKLDGTKGFRLVKANTNLIYLKSLNVTNCQPGGVITESGWNTYSSNKKLDLSTISGGTAFIATSVDGDKIKLKECTDIVDAGKGLMIQGTAGNTFTIDAATDSEETLSETNKMVGLPNGGEAPVGSYVFGWPETDATDYGFYYVNASAATLGAGKAYLDAGGGGARLSIAFEDDEVVTGISELNSSKRTNDVIYDLQGRKVQNPTKGLFITNGHKVFVGNKR